MPEQAKIRLQPKQTDLYNLLQPSSKASVIGVFGGRGSGKSMGADACLISLMYEQPGIKIAMVARNWDMVYRFHIEPVRRNFPWLASSMRVTMPASLKIGKSQMDWTYCESTSEAERRMRSGSWDIVCIEQSEQFEPESILEIRKAARSTGGRNAKLVLLFNLRGASIHWHRSVFHTREGIPKGEDPDKWVSLRMDPWQNSQWILPALIADGYVKADGTADEDTYYSWTDAQRKDYATTRGEYTRQLASGDEAISKADYEGSWDSITGMFFSGVYDISNTLISPGKANAIDRPYATHWVSSDWGSLHFNCTYWHFRVAMSPADVQMHLGWIVPAPLNVLVTYREQVLNGKSASDQSRLTADAVARAIAGATPEMERQRIKTYFLSPECCTDDVNCIGRQQAKELKTFGMPGPVKANNARKDGWALMSKLLRASKFCGMDPETGPLPDVWLITSDCPALLEAIPKATRSPKDLEDVTKTDLTRSDVTADVLDAVRYGLLSMLAPRKKTADDEHQEALQAALQSEDKSRAALIHALRYFRTQSSNATKPKAAWQQRLQLLAKH